MQPATESSSSSVQRRYEDALASFVEKAKQDPYVLAVVLVGSLSYDVVWEKSDIDLFVITQEGKQKNIGLALVENGVNIHAMLTTRSEFKRTMEGAVQGTFMNSLLSKGKMLFTRDETLEELYDNRSRLGARDREIRLMGQATWALPSLAKAQKWFHVKRDMHYSFFWIMKLMDALAGVEAVWNGEVPGREVIHQALRFNPEFFGAVYTDLIQGPKTEAEIGKALTMIEGYLVDRAPVLFKPLFDHLAEAGGVRSVTELEHHFGNQMNLMGAEILCEWLADMGMIEKVSSPVRLTDKSRVDVDEAAYYYEGER
jgi:hypothetical protein